MSPNGNNVECADDDSSHSLTLRNKGDTDADYNDSEQADKQDDERDDEQDDEYDEPKVPKTFVPSNLLVILVAWELSKYCEHVINYVLDEKAVKQLENVPSRRDSWKAGIQDGTPLKGRVAQSTRDDVITSLKRYTDYSEVYKEANAAKDDFSRKRLELEIMEEDVHCWGLSTTQLFHIIKT